MSNGEREVFREAIGELGERISEILAEGTEMTPEEIEAIVDELETPDR